MEVDHILATGSFKIEEWFVSTSAEEPKEETVSSPEEEISISKEYVLRANKEHNEKKNVNLDGEEGIKTSGVNWNPVTNKFSFTVRETKIGTLTKRTVLSRISRLFDPLGLASVVTIGARVTLQKAWKAKEI